MPDELIKSTVDASKALSAIASLYDAMVGKGMDASNVIRDEARLLAKTIAGFTPPPRGQGSPKELGEHAVERELKNLISEASPTLIDEVGSAHGIHNIQAAYIREKDGQTVQLNWENLDPTGNRLEEYHKQYRNDRGKVPLKRSPAGTWSARVVVPVGTRDPYIKKVKARVGRAKAAWALTASKLGESVPNWISKHFASLGTTAESRLDGLQNPIKPSVIFGSRAPGTGWIRAQVQAALNARAKTIAKKIKLILSDYKKDLAQSYRTSRKAGNYKESGPPAE